MISFATSTAPGILKSISDTFNDPGFLTVVVLIISIPLAFYVIYQIISLFTSNDKKIKELDSGVKELNRKIKNEEDYDSRIRVADK